MSFSKADILRTFGQSDSYIVLKREKFNTTLRHLWGETTFVMKTDELIDLIGKGIVVVNTPLHTKKKVKQRK